MPINEVDRETARKNRDMHRDGANRCCDMSNKAISEYSRFIGVLSGIVLGLSPLLLGNNMYNPSYAKILLAIALVLIIFSLPFGAINMLLECKFFEKWVKKETLMARKWDDVATNKLEFAEAQEFEEGICACSPTRSPVWPLITQSVMFFIGFISLFVVIITKIFQ